MICGIQIDLGPRIIGNLVGVSDSGNAGASTSTDNLVGVMMDYLLRRLRAEADGNLLPHGMKSRHAIALTLLRDFGEQAQSDLPQALGIDATGVVALLNGLEEEGLIERRRSPEDRRRHIVMITKAGRRRLDEIERVAAQIEKRMLGLTPRDQAALHTLLSKAVAHVASAPSETDSAVKPQ